MSIATSVGVQYGYKALLGQVITAEDFVTLNENIGGVDADSNATAASFRPCASASPE